METRVGRLEGVVETLTQDVQEVARSVGTLGKEIGNLRDIISEKIDLVTERMGTATKTNWGNVAAWAAVIVTIVGLAGTLVAVGISGLGASIAEAKAKAVSLDERAYQAQYEKGKSDAIASEAARRMTDIEIGAQREVTLALAATDAKIKGLDDKTQSELQATRQDLDSYAAMLTEQILDLRRWRLDHAEQNGEFQGRVAAKQLITEESLKRLDDRQLNYRMERLRMLEQAEVDDQRELVKGKPRK